MSRGRKVGIAKILRKETAVAAADALPVRGGHASGSALHTPTISAPGLKQASRSHQPKEETERHTLVTTSHREQLWTVCVVVPLPSRSPLVWSSLERREKKYLGWVEAP